MKSGREVIASLRTPGYRPASLAPFVERFDKLGLEWAACRGLVSDAEADLERLKSENVRSAGEAIARGDDPPDSAKAEAKAEAALAALKRKLLELSVAVDLAGNDLAKAVAAERDAWLESLRPVEAEQAARIRSALATAKDAAGVLAGIRSSRLWLQEFDAGLATVGRQPGYVGGGSLGVDARKARLDRNREPSVADLLTLAGTVIEEPEPEPVYVAMNASEASF